MAGLTPKQEAFALAYIQTGNASDAYRAAYEVKAMTDKSVNETASRLLKNVKVASRIAELRAPAVQKAGLTLDKHLDDLVRLRNMAVKDGKWSAAIQAEIARGKAAGLYVERHEHGGVGGGPVAVAAVDMRALNDQELEQLQLLMSKAKGAGG